MTFLFEISVFQAIRTHAISKVGQDQVSGEVSVIFWNAQPVAIVSWKPRTIR